MHKDSKRIGLACFLGAFVGGLVALDLTAWFDAPYLWIVGVLVGGGVAYLAYDFREVGQGFRYAFREVVAWQPDRAWWKQQARHGLYVIPLAIEGQGWLLGLVSILEPVVPIPGHELAFVLCMLFIFISVTGMVWMYTALEPKTTLATMRRAAFLWFPPITFCVLIWQFLRLSVRVPGWLFRGAIVAKNVIVHIFRYIHSERRMLCCIDAAVGATAGFFYGSAVVGGLIGAVFGVVNFEIVSIRWLKLVPARS